MISLTFSTGSVASISTIFISGAFFIAGKDESIPVRSLVIAHLKPQLAADVINQMQGEEKTELIKRIAKMKAMDPEAVRRVDKAMHEKMKAIDTNHSETMDGRGALAEILKRMSSSAENEILASLEESDADLTSDLRRRLFTTDDFVNADDRFIQDNNDEGVLEYYIKVLIAEGNTTQALAMIEKRLPSVSAKLKSSLYYERSRLQTSSDKILADLRSSLTSNPRNRNALFALYSYYMDAADYRKAQYYLKQVLALNPSDQTIIELNNNLDAILSGN